MTNAKSNSPVPHQLPGCAVGVVLGFVVIMAGASVLGALNSSALRTLGEEPVVRTLVAVLFLLGAMAAGAGLIRVYAGAVERRWGVSAPDTVGMLRRDLPVLLIRGPGFRIGLPEGTSVSERLRHEALFILKWAGIVLILVGAVAAVIMIMSALGVGGL